MTRLLAADAPAEPALLPADNPFAAPSPLPLQTPAFDKIRNEHFKPAFLAGMQQQLKEMQAIANQKEPPTFENTIVPIEKSGTLLVRVSNVFDSLSSAEKNAGLQEIETELAPVRAAHSDNLLLNRPLFQRVETLWNRKTRWG